MPTKKTKIWQELNFIAQCKKYNVPLWQCPSFLFLITGVITIVAMLSTYIVAAKYAQPEIVALIVICVTTALVIIGYFVTQGFEKLAQANQMKSEFVSIVSHQLRTPLTGVKWAINLIVEEYSQALDKKQLELIKDLKDNNQRMINLVNDLLSVSRIDQGRLDLNPEKTSLKKLTQELIKEYTPIAKASNIELSLQAESNLPSVFIDQRAIRLALGNLIDNGIRYTKGGNQVKINLIKKAKSVRYEVEDHGVGIPKEDQKKIFQKFFRSRNVMKYQTEGTGLGLFIAKAIIEASKGKIGFRSQENKGSTFWIELPIKQ